MNINGDQDFRFNSRLLNINSNNNALASGYATPISLRHKT